MAKRQPKEEAPKESISLKLDQDTYKRVNAIAGALGISRSAACSTLVRIGIANFPKSMQEIKSAISRRLPSEQQLVMEVAEGVTVELDRPIKTSALNPNKFYFLKHIEEAPRFFLIDYLNVCKDFPKLLTSEISRAEEDGVDGAIVKRLKKCINRPTWHSADIIKALKVMDWYNLSNPEAKWKGATINWLTSKTHGETEFGYERLLTEYRRKHGTSIQQLEHSVVRRKYSEAESAQLHDVFKKICIEQQLLRGQDLYNSVRDKLVEIAGCKTPAYVVKAIGQQKNSFEALNNEYAKICGNKAS